MNPSALAGAPGPTGRDGRPDGRRRRPAVVIEELESLQDGIVADQSEPAPFRRQAEENYGVAEYPDSVRLRAALIVVRAPSARRQLADARAWYGRALELAAPGDDPRRGHFPGVIGHLEPQPN